MHAFSPKFTHMLHVRCSKTIECHETHNTSKNEYGNLWKWQHIESCHRELYVSMIEMVPSEELFTILFCANLVFVYLC